MELSMKSDGHLENVSFVDALQMSIRYFSQESSYVLTELVCAGDRDIHMDMSFCLRLIDIDKLCLVLLT